MGIAEGLGPLGKPIKVDLTTLKIERPRFARVCIEVNMKKPLKVSIMVNGKRYYVAYKGLTNICSMCGVVGHAVEVFPKQAASQLVKGNMQDNVERPVLESQNTYGFTEVRRRGRHAPEQGERVVFQAKNTGEEAMRQSPVRPSGEKQTAMVISNSFSGLEGEVEAQ